MADMMHGEFPQMSPSFHGLWCEHLNACHLLIEESARVHFYKNFDFLADPIVAVLYRRVRAVERVGQNDSFLQSSNSLLAVDSHAPDARDAGLLFTMAI